MQHTMQEDEHEQAATAKNSCKLQSEVLDCRTAGLQDSRTCRALSSVVLGTWVSNPCNVPRVRFRTFLNVNPSEGTNARSDTAGLGRSWVEDVPSRDPGHSCAHLRSTFSSQEWQSNLSMMNKQRTGSFLLLSCSPAVLQSRTPN